MHVCVCGCGFVCESEKRVCGLRWGGSPRTRSTPDARCCWRRSGSSASLTDHSRRTWERRGARSPRCSTPSRPFPWTLGRGSELQPQLSAIMNQIISNCFPQVAACTTATPPAHHQIQTHSHSVHRRSAEGARSGPALSGCPGETSQEQRRYIMFFFFFSAHVEVWLASCA